MFSYAPFISHGGLPRLIVAFGYLLLLVFLSPYPTSATAPTLSIESDPGKTVPPQTLSQQEFHYHMADAGEVWLVWGIDGWQAVTETIRPSGTFIKDKLMHTPMDREDNVFVARLQVPTGATIDYGFLITKTRSGFIVRVWDGGEAFQKSATGDDKIEIDKDQTLAMLIHPKATPIITPPNTPLFVQEFRYQMADAGEVWLVWGLNGWQLAPDALRPPGTVIQDDHMNTPMVREGDSFTAKITVPAGSTVDYGFRIERTRTGREIKFFDSAQGASKKVTASNVMATISTVTLSPELTFGSYLLIAILVLLLITFLMTLNRTLPWHLPWTIPSGLVTVTLLGLLLRLWAASQAGHLLSATPVLSGDEPGYDYMANSLLQGTTIDWPCRTPLYPLFLAASYWVFGHSFVPLLAIQALVGTSVIPLTFLLARRFTGGKSALLAAGIIAIHPTMILHVSRLYTEVLFTPLVILTVLTLLRALETPTSGRFALGGAVLGLTNLTRPTAALFPLILPLLLTKCGKFWTTLRLWALYGSAMATVIAPWSYHNYQTYHTFLPLSVTTAVLWQGSPEYYHLMEKERPYIRIWNEDLNPHRNGGLDVCTINGDRYFTERALSSIQKEPGTYLLYVTKKIAFFWIGHPAADWPSYAIFSVDAMRPHFSTPQIIGFFASRLLPFFALIALLSLWGRLLPFMPLLVLCGYFTLVHSLTYGEIRHSEPLHPFLATFIAAALSRRGNHKEHVLSEGGPGG